MLVKVCGTFRTEQSVLLIEKTKAANISTLPMSVNSNAVLIKISLVQKSSQKYIDKVGRKYWFYLWNSKD